MTIEAKEIFYRSQSAFLKMSQDEKEAALSFIRTELNIHLKYIDYYRTYIECAKVFLRIYDKQN